MSTVRIDNGIRNTSGRTLLRNSGVIINTQMLKYNSEIALSDAVYNTIFTLTCTKLLPADQSDLHVIWKIPGCGNYSYVCGAFLSVGGVISFDNRYFYSAYGEPDGALYGNEIFEGVGAGTAIPVSAGWSVADSGFGNKPYNFINPVNQRNDNRRRGPASSNILIFEVVK